MGAGKQNKDKLHRDKAGGCFNNKCYCENNGGYSLIELVIVFAIIAIIMSTVFYSIILIFSANARSCANDIQRSIGDCKVTTMGKSSAYMELYRDAGNENVYTQMYVLDDSGAYQPYGEPQRVGTRRVTVKYMPEGGSGTEPEIPVGRGSGIEIWFDRATGGFKEDKSGNLYDWIRVEGGIKNYKIVLTKLTGKSEVVPEAAAP